MPSPASYQVLLRYTVSSEVDITKDVEALTLEREIATFQEGLKVGRAEVQLTNDYGRYTPTNSNTPLNLIPGLEVQISGVSSGSGGSQVIFKGTVDETAVFVGAPSAPPTATLRLSDATKALVKQETFSSFYTKSISVVSSICAELLVNGGIATTAFSLSITEQDRRGIVGVERQPIADALYEFIKTGGYVAYVARNGVLRMRQRGAIGSGTAVTTYQHFYNYEYGYSDDGVLNKLRLETQDYEIDPSESSVFPVSEDEAIAVPSSGFVTLSFDYVDTDRNFVKLYVASVTTMNVKDAETGAAGNLNSSYVALLGATTAVFSIFNGEGTQGWLRESIEIRGRETENANKREMIFSQASSQAVYGIREHDVESDVFGGSSMMNIFKDYVFARYADPSPSVNVTLRNAYPFILTADLSNKLAIIHSETGIRMQMGILAMRESIEAGPDGWKHDVEYRLRDANKI